MIVLALLATALADVHSVEVDPSAAVVFADRAAVTRTAAISPGAGRQEVEFVDLPATLLTTGVTADVRGPAVLRGIDLRHVTASEVADARVKEIDEAVRALRAERQTHDDAATAAKAELAAIEQSRSQAAAQLSRQLLVGERAPAQASALRTTLSTEDAAARERLRDAEIARRDVDERISALERERATLGSSATDTWTAVVHLEVDRAARVEVDLTYLVRNASWSPRYDIRGDAEGGAVQVALSAMVAQATGEDWQGVKLTVSSAKPGLGTTMPTLDPFWLQRPVRLYPSAAPARKESRAAAAPMAAAADVAEEEMLFEPEPEPMAVVEAQVDTQLAATTFVTPHPETVPSDGTQRKVLLTTRTLESTLRHVTVPRLDPRAYLVGELTNSADFPLLAGPAGVFLADAYLGDFQLDTVAPGDTFDVAFGVDDQVTVERKPVAIEEGDKPLVGKRSTASWEWRVTVRNGHRRPIDVVVHEQVPVTSREDVEVAMKSSIPPEKKDGGLLEFPLPVKAGAQGALTWSYEITYPSDLSLGWME